MRALVSFLVGVAVAAAVLGLYVLHVPWGVLATVAAGLLCLAWLLVVVVLPWNVYFQARHVLFEMERSLRRGIAVVPEQQAEARRVEHRMLRVSLVVHVVSAALLALGAVLFSQPLAWAFSALFLLSTLFRPGVEYYRYLRRRLSDLLADVTYPRDDVHALVSQVRATAASLESLQRAHEALERDGLARDQAQQRKLDAVARRFDETLDRLTDNREIVAGLRAFLRMVREPNRWNRVRFHSESPAPRRSLQLVALRRRARRRLQQRGVAAPARERHHRPARALSS
jgi:hypothetical protein